MTPTMALVLAGLCVDAGAIHEAERPLWLPGPSTTVAAKRPAFTLRPWRDGYIYEAPRFEARISHEGVVTFTNRHAQISLFPVSWIDALLARREPTRDPWHPLEPSTYSSRPWRPLPGQALAPQQESEQSEICPQDSSCSFPATANMVSVAANFDLTDEIMRGIAQDPWALDKAQFLSATFELRMKLAVEARVADMKDALVEKLPHELDRLWADQRYTDRERRRILYDLWYQTDRTPSGQLAARILASFIRERLPCDSSDAYTGAELREFARVHPDRPFAAVEDCGPAAPSPAAHP